jgi:hypothetical protein
MCGNGGKTEKFLDESFMRKAFCGPKMGHYEAMGRKVNFVPKNYT